MDSNGRIEIGLGQARFHRHHSRLHDLWRFGADHVQPHDPVVRGIDDHLVQAAFVAARQDVFHRTEIGMIDLDRAKSVARFAFGHADRSDRRMAEHRAGHAGMINRVRFNPAEHRIRKRLPFANGDRGELHAVSHIAHGIDVIDIGAAEGIDHDFAPAPGSNADVVQPQPFDIGHTARRHHHRVKHPRIVPGQLDQQAAIILLFNIFEFRVETEFDPLGQRDLQQAVAHAFIIAAQNPVRTVGDRDLAAECVEDSGKFIGDIAPARDQDAARDGVEMERLVRGDDVFISGKVRNHRARARGDQDIFGGDDLAARQRDLVIAGDGRAFIIDSDIMVAERLAIQAFEAADVGLYAIAQLDPVKAFALDRPPELLGVFQILGKVGAIDEHLLGNAAADHASAADPVFLCHRDPRAVCCGNPAGAHAARSCPDGEEIIVKFVGHCAAPVGHGPHMVKRVDGGNHRRAKSCNFFYLEHRAEKWEPVFSFLRCDNKGWSGKREASRSNQALTERGRPPPPPPGRPRPRPRSPPPPLPEGRAPPPG